MLKISKNKQTLLKDGKTFFYLADTCWSAFTNISDEEWDHMLLFSDITHNAQPTRLTILIVFPIPDHLMIHQDFY